MAISSSHSFIASNGTCTFLNSYLAYDFSLFMHYHRSLLTKSFPSSFPRDLHCKRHLLLCKLATSFLSQVAPAMCSCHQWANAVQVSTLMRVRGLRKQRRRRSREAYQDVVKQLHHAAPCRIMLLNVHAVKLSSKNRLNNCFFNFSVQMLN